MNINYDSNKFKPGDHVICVDSNVLNIDYYSHFLKFNNHYIINYVKHEYVIIVNSNNSYYSWRFKLDKSYYRKEKLKKLEECSR